MLECLSVRFEINKLKEILSRYDDSIPGFAYELYDAWHICRLDLRYLWGFCDDYLESIEDQEHLCLK